MNHKSGQNVLLFVLRIGMVTQNRKVLLNDRAQVPAATESSVVQSPHKFVKCHIKNRYIFVPTNSTEKLFQNLIAVMTRYILLIS